MNINRNNCEAWFLDFYEGNLPEGQVQELFAFLEKHPDLREVFDSYEAVSFDPDQFVQFDAKDLLKKPVSVSEGITESNYEEYIVGAVEGTLSAEEKIQLEDFFAAHPEKRKELDLIRRTILEPENEIVFEAKDSLKKTVLVDAGNFESLAVEYTDGTLSGEILQAFEQFVSANPEYRKELALYAQTKLQPDTAVVFEDKASLKRQALVISETNFEDVAVASLEGQLNAADEKTFAAYLAVHPEKQKQAALYAQTKLQPDTSIVFEDKDSLRRKKRGGFFWTSNISYAAAAAVALLIGIFWWTNNGTVDPANNGNMVLANNDTVKDGRPQQNSGNETDPFILPKENNDSRMADIHTVSKTGNHSTGFVNTAKTEKISEGFASLDSRGQLRVDAGGNSPMVDFSETFYQVMDEPVVSTSESVSIGQYAMRWMKNKLDERRDEDGELLPESQVVRGAKEDRNVTGFDLTSSALNRIGQTTGSNLHLGKNEQGTVLSVGKYDIWLSHSR